MKVHVVTLPESSWYGDFQILLDLESSFTVEAGESNFEKNSHGRKNMVFKDFVHIYQLEGKFLVQLCEEYPAYKRLLVLRATQRRAYFLKVLEEMHNLIELRMKQ